MLDKLEAKRLVRRRRCPEDRRQVLCWITEPGLSLLAKLDKPLGEAGSRSVELLTRAELRQLISVLEKVRAD